MDKTYVLHVSLTQGIGGTFIFKILWMEGHINLGWLQIPNPTAFTIIYGKIYGDQAFFKIFFPFLFEGRKAKLFSALNALWWNDFYAWTLRRNSIKPSPQRIFTVHLLRTWLISKLLNLWTVKYDLRTWIIALQ